MSRSLITFDRKDSSRIGLRRTVNYNYGSSMTSNLDGLFLLFVGE